MYRLCTKPRPNLPFVNLGVSINAHRQICISPSPCLGRSDRINLLTHDQFGVKAVTTRGMS